MLKSNKLQAIFRNCFTFLLLCYGHQLMFAQKISIQPKTQFRDIQNHIYQLNSHSLSVFVFLDTECPISQQYTSKLMALSKGFVLAKDTLKHSKPIDIQFYTVFPTKGISKQEIEEFNKKYNFNFPAIIDKLHYLTTLFDIHITPEVIVLDAKGNVHYQGAIDNWFYALGKHRDDATELYLKNAIFALLTHNVINPPKTEAIGCYIER